MAGMAGQPAPKPEALGGPVANKNTEAEVQQLMADYAPPQMNATPSPEDDALMQEYAPPPAEPPTEDQFAPEPSFVQANVDQFSNFTTRLQAGLAANDTEKLGYLQKKFGPQNATLKDGKLFFRRSAQDKFKRLDPDTIEIVNDLIPDFAREIVTEAYMFPAEMGGAALGTAAAGPGPGTAGGAIAGRVAAVPAANAFADTLAESAGVPQDPNRDIRQENLIGQGAEAVLPVVGKKIASKIARYIPGTAAYSEAKAAAQKEVVALSAQSQEVVGALKELEKQGLDIPIMSHQIHPDSPSLLQKASLVEKNFPGQFVQKQMDVAEGYKQAIENNLSEIARRQGSGPVKAEALSSVITNAVESLDKSEGKAIALYRAKALATLGNQKQQLPAETSQIAVDLMKQLGFQPKRVVLNSVTRPGSFSGAAARGGIQVANKIERVNWAPPKNLQPYIGRFGLDDSQTRAVVNVLNEYGQLVSRGNEARLTDIERLISRMGPLNQKLGGSGISGAWGKMTGDLRKLRREVIGNSLGSDIEKKLFNQTMDDFGLIRQNTEQLKNVLRDDVTNKTMVQSFFKGKENLANIRAIKKITGEDSPEWDGLRSEFVNQLMLKHASDGPTGFNSKGMLDDLKKNYGDDFIREVFPKKQYAELQNLLVVGKRIEATLKGAKVDNLSEKQERAAADAAIGFIAGIKFKMINGIMNLMGASGRSENALMEIFNRNGYEKYVAGYKGNKTKVAQTLEIMLERYNAARAASKAIPAAEETVKRATRTMLREKAMGHD